MRTYDAGAGVTAKLIEGKFRRSPNGVRFHGVVVAIISSTNYFILWDYGALQASPLTIQQTEIDVILQGFLEQNN